MKWEHVFYLDQIIIFVLSRITLLGLIWSKLPWFTDCDPIDLSSRVLWFSYWNEQWARSLINDKWIMSGMSGLVWSVQHAMCITSVMCSVFRDGDRDDITEFHHGQTSNKTNALSIRNERNSNYMPTEISLIAQINNTKRTSHTCCVLLWLCWYEACILINVF